MDFGILAHTLESKFTQSCILYREKLVDQFSSMLEIENNDIAGVLSKRD